MEFIFIIILIGLYLFYTSKEGLCNCNRNRCIENLVNVSNVLGIGGSGMDNLDINTLKRQDYIRYKTLIFGDKLQFTNTNII